MTSSASAIVCSGRQVTGSTIIPDSERLTLSTSAAWASIERFLWMTPRPPCWAMAIASRDSVTVSIAAEMIGMFRAISAVRLVRRSTSRGWTSECAGQEQDVVERQREGDLAFVARSRGRARLRRVAASAAPPRPVRPVALLVLLARAARARVVAADLGRLRWTVSTFASWPPEAAAP